MRRLATLTAAIGAAFAVTGAQAALLLVDDFNIPAAQVTGGDTTLNGLEAQVFAPIALGGQIGGTRTVFNNLTQNDSNLATPVAITVGGGATGNLDIQNGSLANSTTRLQYNTNAFALAPGPTSILFSLLFSDNGVPNVNTQLVFSFDGAGANDFNRMMMLPQTAVQTPLFLNLTAAEAGFFSGGGILNLIFTGTTSYDLTIDQFAIEIPEPTTLALAGLALLGAGFASRRRKAV